LQLSAFQENQRKTDRQRERREGESEEGREKGRKRERERERKYKPAFGLVVMCHQDPLSTFQENQWKTDRQKRERKRERGRGGEREYKPAAFRLVVTCHQDSTQHISRKPTLLLVYHHIALISPPWFHLLSSVLFLFLLPFHILF
jgi:hypothetical protein